MGPQTLLEPLTVNGTGFVSGASVVRFNGSARPTTFVNSTQLTAAIPASDLATEVLLGAEEEARAEEVREFCGVAFFGIADGGGPFDRLAGREEVAVGGGDEFDVRLGVAGDDGDDGGGGGAGGVGDAEFEDVIAGGFKLDGWVRCG